MGYQPRPAPEQNPPQSISGVIPHAERVMMPSWARSEYVIDDLSIVGQLRTNGFRCEQQRPDSLAWWDTSLPPLGHNETLALKNGTTITRLGAALIYDASAVSIPRGVVEATDPIANDRRAIYQHTADEWMRWGWTAQEASNALAHIYEEAFPTIPEPIGDSSDGIAPCGYEEL